MENIEDCTNITGLSTLVNPNHVDDKLDLDKIEKSMLGHVGIRTVKEADPALEFKNTIRELSEDTGINLDDEAEEPTPARAQAQMQMRAPVPVAVAAARQPAPRPVYAPRPQPQPQPQLQEQEAEESGELSMDDILQGEPASIAAMHGSGYDDFENFDASTYAPSSNYTPSYAPSYTPSYAPSYTPSYTPMYASAPLQHTSSSLDDAMRAYTGEYLDLNLEREREEELKSTLLEDIDELRAELTSDGVDLARIPEVGPDSPIDLVKKVHKTLRMKYDRRRCTSLGTEVIMAGAQGLGYIFDGKRKFGPFSPNLAGWHNTVRSKLRRMNYETSSIVAGIMQEYKVGPFARVMCELVPSAIVYSHLANEQKGEKTYSPGQMSAAYDDLRQFDS